MPDGTGLTKKIKQTILEYLNTKYTEYFEYVLLSLAFTLDKWFKNCHYNDDSIKTIMTKATPLTP